MASKLEHVFLKYLRLSLYSAVQVLVLLECLRRNRVQAQPPRRKVVVATEKCSDSAHPFACD